MSHYWTNLMPARVLIVGAGNQGCIVADILLDMETRDRLQSGHGNAILVSDSIYQACRLFEMFQRTDLAIPTRRQGTKD